MTKSYTEITTNDYAILQRAIYELLTEKEDADLISRCETIKMLQRFLDLFAKADYEIIEKLLLSKLENVPMKQHRLGLQPIYKISELKNHESKEMLSMLPSFYAFISCAKELPREKYHYSVEMEVLFSCCDEHDSFLYEYPAPIIQYICLHPKSADYILARKSLNVFLKSLHSRLRDPKTRKKILDKRASANSSYLEIADYVNALFASCEKQAVLRINFGYEDGSGVTLASAKKDIARFYSNKRHNQLFKHQNGFVINIEYGLKKGFYFHLLLFFDISKCERNFDETFAKDVGDYWQRVIVKNNGRYWFCNDKNTLGNVAVIQPDHKETRIDLFKILEHYKKKEQFIKLKVPPKTQLMSKGGM